LPEVNFGRACHRWGSPRHRDARGLRRRRSWKAVCPPTQASRSTLASCPLELFRAAVDLGATAAR